MSRTRASHKKRKITNSRSNRSMSATNDVSNTSNSHISDDEHEQKVHDVSNTSNSHISDDENDKKGHQSSINLTGVASEVMVEEKNIVEIEDENMVEEKESNPDETPSITNKSESSFPASIESEDRVGKGVPPKEKLGIVPQENEDQEVNDTAMPETKKRPTVESPENPVTISKKFKNATNSIKSQRNSDASDPENLDNIKLPTDHHIGQLFKKNDIKSLKHLLKEATDNNIAKLFKDYKKVAERKAHAADSLITNLTKENINLKNTLNVMQIENESKLELDSLKHQVEKLKREKKRLYEENQELKQEMKRSIKNVEEAVNRIDLSNTKLEILEILTRSSCSHFEENEDSLTFSLKQVGDTARLHYQLIVSKSGKSDIVYIPLLQKPDNYEDDWNENVKLLKKLLPDYFLDNLSFPSSTLGNFYTKMLRCLNRKIGD
ncbi:unnamed protein product [Ambrosiozyma monospora]|uniref:Unnamed protein product n=1 Tax=Ambrosiozyma monospora TaxID=43982 RepID=A0A9W6YYP7_AMBMO|nr:unnamed protein product [Ambrosiozyma monospora]